MISKIYIAIFMILSISGCTQVVTVPISIAGTVVGTTLEVTGAAVGAMVGSEDEKIED